MLPHCHPAEGALLLGRRRAASFPEAIRAEAGRYGERDTTGYEPIERENRLRALSLACPEAGRAREQRDGLQPGGAPVQGYLAHKKTPTPLGPP